MHWNPFAMKFLKLSGSKLDLVEDIRIKINGQQLDADTYGQLPLCKNGNMKGRWVKTSMIQSVIQPANFHKDWTTPRDSLTHFQDDEGKVWLPYDCKYLPISYSEFTTCLAKSNSHLHFYGDSNIRRSLKAISTGGAWCTSMTDPSSRECNCEDHMRPQVPFLDESKEANYFPFVGGNTNVSFYYFRFQGFFDNGKEWEQIFSRDFRKKTLDGFGVRAQKNPRSVILNLSM